MPFKLNKENLFSLHPWPVLFSIHSRQRHIVLHACITKILHSLSHWQNYVDSGILSMINYCNYHQPTARPTIGTKPPWEHPFQILKNNKIYRKRLSHVDLRTYLIKKIPLFLYPYQHIRLVISPVPVWDIFAFKMIWVSNTKVKHKTLRRYPELA